MRKYLHFLVKSIITNIRNRRNGGEKIMKKKWLKKGSAVLLAAAMVLSLFPGMKGTLATVQAAENETPTSEYWTDAEGLKNFGISSTKTIGKIRFGLNGSDARLWAICGGDTDGSLALLSTSEFARAAYGSTSKYSESNFVTKLTTDSVGYLSTSYFSSTELGKMADVTVSTNEPDTIKGGNYSVSVEKKKLYLPNSEDQSSFGQPTIYVGSSNDIAIDVTKLDDVGLGNVFWLRSPIYDNSSRALVAYPGYSVLDIQRSVNYSGVSVVPAFNLNLSSDIFASAAEAASSSYTGYKANSEMTANTYTLRYASAGTEEAVISPNGTKIEVKGAKGKYLMVQNNNGVYVLAIDNDSRTVNASDIVMGSDASAALTNFNNCKVWIESTDADRITTAKMATQAASTPTYTITAGAGGTHELSTDGTLSITCDGALDKLTGIYVDDKLVDATNYTLKSGSTILTFKADYLNTLSVGTHKVKFQYSDGSAESTFAIKAASSQNTTTQDTTTSDTTQDTTTPSEKDDAPKAGDSTPIAWLFIIAIISGAGVVYFGRKKKTVR